MLQLHDIFFKFNKKEIIGGVKLLAKKGIIKGLLGHNGAGKTTLFRLIFGFYKPSKGQILVEGHPLQGKMVSFLETEQYFYPYMTGREYLTLIKSSDELIQKWNGVFDLPLDQLVDHYSTGMKKKLAFIGVLLQDRPILLLDEPFNGVDLEGNEKMISVLNYLKAEKIIIISSHALGLLTNISDEIIVLKAGKVTDEITKDQFEDFEQQIKTNIDQKIHTILNHSNLKHDE